MIYSVFAGAGKTSLAKKYPEKIVDAESSYFQWLDNDKTKTETNKGQLAQKNPLWPQNYIEYIIEQSQSKNVLIAAQPIVLDILDKKQIEYVTVSPSANQKQEYINRYIERGNQESFINLMSNNFELFINSMSSRNNKQHIELKKDEFLSTIFKPNML